MSPTHRTEAAVRTDHTRLNLAFESALATGYDHLAAGAFDAAYGAFEQAHVLGQRRTGPHVRSHVAFLRWGLRRGDRREVAGQLVRIVAASLFTWLWMPLGNTGGARVDILKPLPISDEARDLLGDRRR